MPKTKKKPLGGKYKFRRFLLKVLLLVLVGVGGWFAYEKLDGISIPALATMEESSESEPPVSEPEPEPESEPEAEPEPEPEPEKPAVSSEAWELIVVNEDNPLPDGYTPELETITDSYRVDKRIADNVKLMFADAKASGINLTICSAYRSIEKQSENFNNKAQEYISEGKTEDEAVAAVATIIAKPGMSEHHTGLALDIVTPSYQSLDEGFASTPAFKWLDGNAHKYGFILRYPQGKENITNISYEPWHYRYVGEENAAVIKGSGLCLEEYVAALKGAAVLTGNAQDELEDTDEPQSEEQSESGEETAG